MTLSRRQVLPALLALAGALFATLASDWIIKSLIKQLTEEPRPYLLWLESQELIPAIRQFYAGSQDLRSEQVHAATVHGGNVGTVRRRG